MNARFVPLTLAIAVALALAHARPAIAQSRNLEIYWVDVEGGAATLVVSPSGESLLYDSGWEVGDRDAKRIADAAKTAGLSRIDTSSSVISTPIMRAASSRCRSSCRSDDASTGATSSNRPISDGATRT